MENMAENMDWEKEAPILSKIRDTNPLLVPKGYFDTLSERINESVFVAALQANHKPNFKVPDGYFEALSTQLQATIALEELTSTRETGFTTPKNYFKSSLEEIKAKTTSPSKVRKLWLFSPISKYSAAASVIVLLTGAWFFNSRLETQEIRKSEIANEQILLDIDESAIVSYIQEDNISTEKPSQEELEEYILNNLSSYDISKNL
jgi:hypothetical protein